MNIEYEEFSSIEDVFMFLASAAAPMKNTLPINCYKGHTMSFIPLGALTENFLMVYAKGTIESGTYEFDVSANEYHSVQSIERADKIYFIVLTPKRHTIADKALAEITDS